MVKNLAPTDWTLDRSPVAIVKVASDGLRGNDMKAFVKRAGQYLAHEFKKIAMAPGEIPVHLIAVSSTEWNGANRNGDGFKEKTCVDYHPTFEKYARWYRDHLNTDPSRSYGTVKRSFFNPEMHRIELIVGLNGTKEAADKNGGLLADKEMEKLANDQDIGVSMSCLVKHDCCSWCGNKATKRAYYCTEATCGGGGLAEHMGTMLKCGHMLHADNPAPRFFDISHVKKPADRTAWVTGVLEKAAGAVDWAGLETKGSRGGAALAEAMRIQAPRHLWLPDDGTPTEFAKIALALAELENGPRHYRLLPAFGNDFGPNVARVLPENPEQLHKQAESVLGSLADRGVIVSPETFLTLFTGSRTKAATFAPGVTSYLPGVYDRLIDNRYVENLTEGIRTARPIRQDFFAKSASCALTDSMLRRRIQIGTLRNENPKPLVLFPANLMFKNAEALELMADVYGGYTIQALRRMEKSYGSSGLTREALLIQNRVYR